MIRRRDFVGSDDRAACDGRPPGDANRAAREFSEVVSLKVRAGI